MKMEPVRTFSTPTNIYSMLAVDLDGDGGACDLVMASADRVVYVMKLDDGPEDNPGAFGADSGPRGGGVVVVTPP